MSKLTEALDVIEKVVKTGNEAGSAEVPGYVATPTFAGVQHAIIVAMRDLCDNADDTVWITEHETMFERLCELHKIAGGKEETLAGIWPEYF